MSDLLDRLLARDASLWPPGNVSATRLGWLDVAERMAGEAAELQSWAETVDAERVVLLGMGGSSLGPEVLRAAFGSEVPDPTGMAVSRWGADPYARGSYSHIAPGSSLSD